MKRFSIEEGDILDLFSEALVIAARQDKGESTSTYLDLDVAERKLLNAMVRYIHAYEAYLIEEEKKEIDIDKLEKDLRQLPEDKLNKLLSLLEIAEEVERSNAPTSSNQPGWKNLTDELNDTKRLADVPFSPFLDRFLGNVPTFKTFESEKWNLAPNATLYKAGWEDALVGRTMQMENEDYQHGFDAGMAHQKKKK